MSTENKLENILPTKEEIENKRNEFLKKDLETLRQFLLDEKTDTFPRELEDLSIFYNIQALINHLDKTKSIYKIKKEIKSNISMFVYSVLYRETSSFIANEEQTRILLHKF
jgi:excinuclease UvrABC helicase subunit UvrB